MYRLRRDHRIIRHRGPLSESLRQQIPPAITFRRRYQAISAGEYIGREVQGIEGRRGKRRVEWQGLQSV